MAYKKAPAIHPIFFKRKCKKGKYFPKINGALGAAINKNRKWMNKRNKERANNMKTFKDIYKFPLRWDEDFSMKVFGDDGAMAFDFPFGMLKKAYPNMIILPNEAKKMIVDVVNGESKGKINYSLTYNPDDTIIYADVEGTQREFIIVRGWGNLTGQGGHNLKEEKAIELQTAFANHIIKSITDEG